VEEDRISNDDGDDVEECSWFDFDFDFDFDLVSLSGNGRFSRLLISLLDRYDVRLLIADNEGSDHTADC
jgi:DNA-binding GntR family transcriptional regulator